MLRIHLCLIVLMTAQTGKNREVRGGRMARLATIPLALMLTRKNREVWDIVIKRRTSPRISRVAIQTRRRETRSRVLRVINGAMAGYTVILICC